MVNTSNISIRNNKEKAGKVYKLLSKSVCAWIMGYIKHRTRYKTTSWVKISVTYRFCQRINIDGKPSHLELITREDDELSLIKQLDKEIEEDK